jgi:hypothetical protein
MKEGSSCYLSKGVVYIQIKTRIKRRLEAGAFQFEAIQIKNKKLHLRLLVGLVLPK